jgi:hypothetical protein
MPLMMKLNFKRKPKVTATATAAETVMPPAKVRGMEKAD